MPASASPGWSTSSVAASPPPMSPGSRDVASPSRARCRCCRFSTSTQRWQSLLAYGRVLHVLGRPEDAAAAWKQALAIVESIGGSLPADVRDAFRRSSGYLAAAELAS